MRGGKREARLREQILGVGVPDDCPVSRYNHINAIVKLSYQSWVKIIDVKERNEVSERSDPAANFGSGTVDLDPFLKDLLDLLAN